LGVIRALGDRLEPQGARPKSQGVSSLVRALNYPDRRVQFAAADTLLRLPGAPPPQAPGRVIEILRRVVQSDPGLKVIIADPNRDRGLLVADAVKKSGYEPIVVQTGREVLERLAEAADIDAIFVDHQLPNPALRTLLSQLRADVDTAQLPLFVTIPPLVIGNRPAESVIPLQRMIEPYRNVFLIEASNDPDVVKPLLDTRIAVAMGKPLTEDERKATMAEAMVWLKRLAVGEVPGYNAKGAESAIVKAMRSEELGALAVEAAGRLPGRTVQRELATILLDEAVRAEVRSSAAVELARQINANRLALAKTQIVGIEAIFNKTEDARLKANVALVLGALRPDLYKTGDRLKAFVPLPAAPEKPEPGKEKMDKEKAMEKEKDKDKN
jgi:CheY-like chemotaxis protein